MAMIDVSSKAEVLREATASGTINLKPETIKRIREGNIAKGDPLYTAKIAAILAAKKTSELIPLCHPSATNKRGSHTKNRLTKQPSKSLPLLKPVHRRAWKWRLSPQYQWRS